MKTEKEIKAKLEKFSRVLEKKTQEAQEKQQPSYYAEASFYLLAVQSLAWVLGEKPKIRKDKK